MQKFYPSRYFRYEYLSDGNELVSYFFKKNPTIMKKWYIKENTVTKHNYKFDLSDYVSICSNSNYEENSLEKMFSLAKCYSLKTQIFSHIIRKYQEYQKKFNILPEDLRYQLNYQYFIENALERKAEIKYICYPQNEKFSKSHMHMCDIVGNYHLTIGYNFKYNDDHYVSKDYYLFHDCTNCNYNLGIWETHDFNIDDDWEDFIDLSTYFDFNLDMYLDRGHEIDNIKNFKKIAHICKLVNQNPYIDGKIKFFNVINKTYTITELFQLKCIYC